MEGGNVPLILHLYEWVGWGGRKGKTYGTIYVCGVLVVLLGLMEVNAGSGLGYEGRDMRSIL